MKKALILILAICLALATCAGAAAEGGEGYAEIAESLTEAAGTLGYSMYYDPELITFSGVDGIDLYDWILNDDELPRCFISVSVLDGYTPESAMGGLILQAGYDGERGSIILDGIEAQTYRFSEGSEWNSRVCEYICVPIANGSTLLIEMDYYIEAEEGVGARFAQMLDTFVLGGDARSFLAQCGICGGWFAAGEDFTYHVCAEEVGSESELVLCDVCGGWFPAGNVFRNHICNPKSESKSESEPQTVQCDVCGGWFMEGNEFRNHICNTEPEPQTVQCDVCGGWFMEGNEFRNHICAGE